MITESCFRPIYRPLSDQEKQDIERLKESFENLFYQAQALSHDHRYLALTRTALEEACFWAVKGATG